jgi:hypothetical protein
MYQKAFALLGISDLPICRAFVSSSFFAKGPPFDPGADQMGTD